MKGTLFQISLWGNRCDLSISCGADRPQEADLIFSLDKLRPNILENNSDSLWQLLVSLPEDQRDIGELVFSTFTVYIMCVVIHVLPNNN